MKCDDSLDSLKAFSVCCLVQLAAFCWLNLQWLTGVILETTAAGQTEVLWITQVLKT